MGVVLYVLLGLSFFIWPISHAVFGRTPKTVWLKRIFFFLVISSLLVSLLTLIDLRAAKDRSEVLAGGVTLLYLLTALSLVASLIAIGFVKNFPSDSRHGVDQQPQ